jgi:hypothetical protein
MPNITLSIDEEIIKKVRKYAVDKNTTLTSMVRAYLKSVALHDAQEKKIAFQKLSDSFQTFSRDMGARKWKREDVYDRQNIS